ncbi:thyrotroph embryonic factor isoform X1 [Aplysia californica]|uniref:Thyrotroph embryonic factor isoform X1 n=1 Tax=Aplysia californica TaxID=6500 RepID=A0ABM0JY62_APLCA|nr:thyrotroph embryonic factor isoform X1 [Aplysia californica]
MSMPPHFLGSMTLKALLEDPNLKNPPLVAQSSDQIKVKKEDKDSDLPQFNYGSAFLGPNLWDKTYDNVDFNLEYMDLDEFLSENGIPVAGEEGRKDQLPAGPKEEAPPPAMVANNVPIAMSNSSPRQYLRTPPMSPSQFLASPGPSSPTQYPSVMPAPQPVSKSPSPPVSPFSVEFQVSEQDLALSSIPDYHDGYRPKWQAWTHTSGEESSEANGHEDFDPRKRNFSEEELKPQPVIKKSKKVFVPDEMKDEKYWNRRHKNNYAAKRSRDARRVKENQIAMRAAFLEKENGCLRDEVNKLRKENAKLKAKMSKYEPSAGVDPASPISSLPIS